MTRTILVVSRNQKFLLGMSQALLKFGYPVMTSTPEAGALEQLTATPPSLVLANPPHPEAERRQCLDLVQAHYMKKGIPVMVCVATQEEGAAVQEYVRGVHLLAGNPVRLNDLYTRLQTLFEMAQRRELRITTELAVAHREAELYQDDFYYYDTITSLSVGGCFIRTRSPYAIGTRLEMVFCAGSASRSVKLRGNVVHHGHPNPGAPALGMGIQFEELSPADRSSLESYLISQMGMADMPATL